jgi:hypothetical protein
MNLKNYTSSVPEEVLRRDDERSEEEIGRAHV